MLGILFEYGTKVVKSTYDVVADSTEYIIDDIASIPDAVAKGWEEGFSSSDEKSELEQKLEEEITKVKDSIFTNKDADA